MKEILFGSIVTAALIFSGCGSSSSSSDDTNTSVDDGKNDNNGTDQETGTDLAPANETVVSVNGTDWTVVKTADILDDENTTDVNESFTATKTWAEAVDYCTNIEDTDSTWALPTLEQAKTLVTDINSSDPEELTFDTYNTDVMPEGTVYIWTGESFDSDDTKAWIVYAGGKQIKPWDKTEKGYVTCVKQ